MSRHHDDEKRRNVCKSDAAMILPFDPHRPRALPPKIGSSPDPISKPEPPPTAADDDWSVVESLINKAIWVRMYAGEPGRTLLKGVDDAFAHAIERWVNLFGGA